MRFFPLYGFAGLALLAGCGSVPVNPAASIPVAVQPRDFYRTGQTFVRDDGGECLVSGQLSVLPGYSIPDNFYAHVRFLAADGRLLADVPAQLDAGDPPHRGELRRPASFSAETAIRASEVAKIVVTFVPWPMS